jgi:nitroreductase
MIRGAPAYIVGALRRSPYAMEDYGYCLQGIILAATALGLGPAGWGACSIEEPREKPWLCPRTS